MCRNQAIHVLLFALHRFLALLADSRLRIFSEFFELELLFLPEAAIFKLHRWIQNLVLVYLFLLVMIDRFGKVLVLASMLSCQVSDLERPRALIYPVLVLSVEPLVLRLGDTLFVALEQELVVVLPGVHGKLVAFEPCQVTTVTLTVRTDRVLLYNSH